MPHLLFWVFLFLMTVVIHEVCHGLVANWFGDPTAQRAGRLTLNPLKHVDPFWTVLFPLFLYLSTGGRFLIGMAKPVPVDFRRLRSPKRDMIWVALAGPMANILLACVLNIFWKIFESPYLLYSIYFNLGIAFFNLVPIPPLDGSRIVAGILPYGLARFYLMLEPYGFFIVFILYVTGYLFYLIIPGIDLACRVLDIPWLSRYLMAP